MFAALLRRALDHGQPTTLRLVRLATAWVLLNAPAASRHRLADRLGGDGVWGPIKLALVGIAPNWLERRLIATAKRQQDDPICAIVVLALFQ